MDALLSEFLTETSETLDVVELQLVRFEREPKNAETLDSLFRLVHTIKGTCGFLGLSRLELLAHATETLMGSLRDGAPVTASAVAAIFRSIDRIKSILGAIARAGREPQGSDQDLISQLERLSGAGVAAFDDGDGERARPSRTHGEDSLDGLERAFREAPGPDDAASVPIPEPESAPVGATAPAAAGHRRTVAPARSIRVGVDTIEHLMTMVRELVLTRNQLVELARHRDDRELRAPLRRLSSVTAELQQGVMRTRMQPIGNAWQRLPRLVRDLANDLGKKIELEMLGTETELDREVLELITDPLSHMVRNAADHGIETPAERRAGGKRESGRIVLRAFHDGDHIIIDISDDGRGLPIDRIRAEVAQRGLATGADLDGLSPAQISRFIFAPGISTADDVTTVSGRGVGMDVVRTNVELIGGSIDVRSEAGRGSTFTIKVPLTLAIVPALIVGAAGQRFAIPQLNVTELVRAGGRSGHRIGMVGRAPVLRLRGRLVPLVRLAAVLGIEAGWPLADTGPDGDAAATGQGFIIVAHAGGQTFGMHVDAVFAAEEIVVKPTSTMLRDITVFSGNTILGDGSVIMILDPGAIARQVSGGFQNAGPAALGAAEPGSGRRRELLLIDDSPFFRDMLVPVLKSAGYAVTAVHSATEALALKRDGRAFDVIVCDLEMPGIDGFAFANRVRNDRDWKDTPLIALSCFGDGTERARGHAAGFHDLVGKFDRERLVRSVGRSLRELEDAA